MKSTILLTTALFLASAPSPDSKTVSELTAGFLAEGDSHGLMAAGFTADTSFDENNAVQLAIQNKHNAGKGSEQIN